ncbi:MAG TPA: cellulase family glycosylhydrolase [Actinophytocola sp.]|uniref:cellulase family glycosylhydrolase n=1 Tax=Actinophytocola sp. TaxID=1872138 RepID=UPI002DBA66FC|nr:cellulase family glycosylhydrolase [Actinophytocola sp.]HEU5470290.1 cellulase family glycosylhydrolase [Actinophytocola sp.]
MKKRTTFATATVLALLASLLVLVQPAAAAVGLRVNGTRIVESNGNTFVMRGVSHPHIWFPQQTSSFAAIKATGANTVRVVLGSGQRWGPNTASDVSNVIALCKQNRLICVLEVHDTTGFGEEGAAASLDQAASYWISIASALMGQENFVVINIGNEPMGNNQQVSSTWATATSNAITRLRNAGFDHLIMVDAPMWGQDWQGIMRTNAATVFNADPDRNTVFSVHMYGVYDTAAEINDYLNTFQTAGLPLVIGEFGFNHSDGDPDENTIMAQAVTRGVGYIGWSWSGNGCCVEYLDMVTGFNPAQLTPWGERIINGANGIRSTSREATIYGGSGPPDTQPPTTPGTPTVGAVTATSVALTWTASTDNNAVTGYEVYRATGASGGTFALIGTSATNSFTSTGLTPATTYRFNVRARDAVPNFSANSGTVSATTQQGGGTGTCRVTYSASNWGGSSGFTANLTVANTGTTAINGWTLAFTFPGGQRVSLPGWSATWAQASGSADVTAVPFDWNRNLAPNTSTGIGFNGTFSGTNTAPTTFTLNGATCTTG